MSLSKEEKLIRQRVAVKKYRDKHKEATKIRNLKFRELNPNYQRSWYEDNKDSIKERQREYAKENKTTISIRASKWRSDNIERDRANKKAYSRVRQRDHPEIHRIANAKRHADKLQRTPKWSNLEKIKEIYEQAQVIQESTGVPQHVDHVIPLRGKRVSGLHVPNNLQIITASENVRKNNTFLI